MVIIFFAVCFALISACKKDPSTTPPPAVPVVETPPPPFVLKVTIPNIAPHGIFTITTNDTAADTMQLYNRWGSMILNQSIHGTTTFDIVSVPTGVYVYELITRTKTFKGTIYITY